MPCAQIDRALCTSLPQRVVCGPVVRVSWECAGAGWQVARGETGCSWKKKYRGVEIVFEIFRHIPIIFVIGPRIIFGNELNAGLKTGF